jgi:predicted nuclease with TOPRIM domain
LQSSQLIHTNKEYQKAIEIITTKFHEVGNEMSQISELCHQITGGANNLKYSHFDEIREKFEKTSFLTELIVKSVQFSKEKIIIADKQFCEIYNNYIELSDFIKTIEKSIHKSLNNQTSSNSEHIESTVKQIQNILTEIQTINNQYQVQFEKINDLNMQISVNDENQKNKLNNLEKTLASFSELYLIITNTLNNANEKIYNLVSENHTLSTRISGDIKTSIEQIKYYDFFDKVIEEIIIKLNEINTKLQNIEGAENDENNFDMGHLKKRYTMQSEHVIHDNLTIHKNLDLEHLGSTGIEEDDDNLELF